METGRRERTRDHETHMGRGRSGRYGQNRLEAASGGLMLRSELREQEEEEIKTSEMVQRFVKEGIARMTIHNNVNRL